MLKVKKVEEKVYQDPSYKDYYYVGRERFNSEKEAQDYIDKISIAGKRLHDDYWVLTGDYEDFQNLLHAKYDYIGFDRDIDQPKPGDIFEIENWGDHGKAFRVKLTNLYDELSYAKNAVMDIKSSIEWYLSNYPPEA